MDGLFLQIFQKANLLLLLSCPMTVGQEASPVSSLTDKAPGPMMAVAKASG